MRLKKSQPVAEALNDVAVPTQRRRRDGRGWGPFTGGQLTVVIVAICAVFALPAAVGAAVGAFTNNSATVAAVTATNANAKGIGVQGTGKKFGVYSNGPLGVAAGKSLTCTGCVGGGALRAGSVTGSALAPSAKTYCSGYPHFGVDWSIPGSTRGAGCDLGDANLSGDILVLAKLTNAQLGGANLTGAKLDSADLSGTDMLGANLNGAELISANLTNANLATDDVSGDNLTNANLSGAFLHNTNLFGANLTGANLHNAVMSNTIDEEVIWSNTTCPDGTNSDNDGSTCFGHGAP